MSEVISPVCTDDGKSLYDSARELRERFDGMIQTHRHALWRYCSMLTGNKWDGEDLFQDTLLKAFASLAQLWQPMVPRTYLFRIASNTWIDRLRQKRDAIGLPEEDFISSEPEIGNWEVEEAIQALLTLLPPKAIAIYLLMDIIGFSARETAGMIHSTEGSVYTGLHRARRKIREFRERQAGLPTNAGEQPLSGVSGHPEQVKQFVSALSTGDPSEIVRYMSDQMHNDAAPGFQEFNKNDMFAGSMRGFAHGELSASVRTLWNLEVLVVLANTDDGWQLHNISRMEFEEGRLVLQKSYYFCRELLEEAAAQLQVSLQLEKPAVRWQ